MKALEKIRVWGISRLLLINILIKDSKFARFYLLPKIQKQLSDVSGKPVISNCSYYTEIIPSFLDYHLQSLAKKAKSYVKDISHF